ncbi:peptidase M56 family protein [Arthrobacter sp. 18067]|uniref:peptidase M56 family protein n=1 Tax=Arthrobacter sp. 18067 TaxID=2681413 RepID=UPI0013592903|nr:peptidase M56 family protein [Arthrobacter sp. 18067]
MNDLKVDEGFSQALRAELIARVEKSSSAHTRRKLRGWLGVGVFVGAGLLGGVGATAAGLLTIPGAPQITPLGTPVTNTYTGTATIEFGDAPPEATAIRVKVTCLTTGSWAYETGATSTCKAADVDGPTGVTQYQIPLVPGKETMTIRTQAQSQWQLTWSFVNEQSTDWATNAAGDTYGAQNDKGLAQMVAVQATNGVFGYVYNTELEEATGVAAIRTFKTREEALAWQEQRQGKDVSIPVYDSEGKNVVGEFVIQDGGGEIIERGTGLSSPIE